MTISLCIIAKDEEQFLPACLASAKELVDEVVVVDTGSTDKTKEIATAAGAKVFDFPWQNDFAAARNFSLSKATKDWILVLDADEVLSVKDHPRIRELLIWKVRANPKVVGFAFHQRNYTNDLQTADFVPCDVDSGYPEQTGFAGYTLARPVRLFRRGPQYSGAVHEGVESGIKEKGFLMMDSGIPIHHFRERKGAAVAERKRQQYGALAAMQTEATPGEAKPFYELGLTQKAEGKLDDAMVNFKTALALDARYRHPYSNIAEIYLIQKKTDDAVAMLQKAIDTKPAAADYYNLGLLRMKQGKLDDAEQLLRKSIEAAPTRIDFYSSLSAVYAMKKDFARSLKVFDICIAQNPHRVEPFNLLGSLIFKLGKYERAAKIFLQGKAVGAEHPQPAPTEYLKLLINLAETHVKLGEKEKAKQIFQELIERQPEKAEAIRKRVAELG